MKKTRLLILASCLLALSLAGASVSAREPAARVPGSTPPAAPAPTDEVLVFFEPGVDAAAFAAEHGLSLEYSLRSANAAVFRAASSGAAEQFVKAAASAAGVVTAWLNERAEDRLLSFTPNDPYFHKDTPSAPWPGQWYLKNEHTPGLDVNATGAWDAGATGAGVVIGIVDDGLDHAHEDLAPNYSPAHSYDFGDLDPDPAPHPFSDDNHGTSVAGLAAARGGNGRGITGAAPFASLAGLRIGADSAAQRYDATIYHSYGANTGIQIKNHSYGATVPWSPRVLEENGLALSAMYGTIHVWAASEAADDANRYDRQNHWAAITVTALGSNGAFTAYGAFGANIFVCAPASSTPGLRILTTDRSGSKGYNPSSGDTFPNDNYTSRFEGTSASAPIVAGVIALGKEIRPNMDVRFAKHLLVRSSTLVDAGDTTPWSDGGWQTNAAGFAFNQNYGFGLVNAGKFVELAGHYSGVSPLVVEETGLINVDHDIPDNDLLGLSRAFDVLTEGHLEEVLVTLDITHTYRGDVEAYLTSPSGSTRRLFMHDFSDAGENIDWTFLSNAYWGENAAGTWTLMVRDVFTTVSDPGTGRWNSYSVELRMGDILPVPEPATLGLLLLGGATLAVVRRRRVRGR